MWYSQSKVEKWSRRRLAPPFPMGGVENNGTDTIIVNWQKKNTSSQLGEEIRQRAWGSPEEGRGPLCSSESFPFGPQMETWPAAGAQLGSPVFPNPGFWFSVLREEFFKGGGRLCASPAVGHLQREKAGGQLASIPGARASALPAPSGHPQSSQCPILCFWKPGPVGFTASFPGLPVTCPIPVCGCLL